jgi:site-specific DNA-methyltransferase (adenine-specific)
VTPPFFVSGPVTLYRADALELLPELEAGSFHAVVTDPPYGLEFMGRDWERFRVDDSLSSRFRGERAGLAGEASSELVETTVRGGKRRHRPVTIGVQRRPSTSRCQACGRRDVYRKPHGCGDREVWRAEIIDPHAAPPTALAFQEWTRTWGLELLRVLVPGGLALVFGSARTFHRLASGLEDAGFEVRRALAWLRAQDLPKACRLSTLTWKPELAAWGTALRSTWEPVLVLHKPHAQGFKGAALETGSAGLHLGAAGLTDEVGWPADALLDEAVAAELGPERAAYFYVAKADANDRSADGHAPNEHPTVKPLDLMRWLLELARRPSGRTRVLDPFAGSGTTLVAAARLGFEVVGVEKDGRWAALARRRFLEDAPLFHHDETPFPEEASP